MTRKHVAPSRIKYERNHPTISCRVSQQELQKLREVQTKTGLSLAQILRRALGVQLAEAKNAYEKGYREGFERFRAPCSICGKPMDFNLKAEKEAEAKKTLLKAFEGWAHTPCQKSQPPSVN